MDGIVIKGFQIFMIEKQLVSIIMCVHNTNQQWLFEAVNSVLNQTYNNYELLIIDDDSDIDLYQDDIFHDPRIKIYRMKKSGSYRGGVAAARNIGLNNALGKYIAMFDSDDICRPERIEKQVNFLECHKNIVASGTWYDLIGDRSGSVEYIIDDNEYYRCCLLFGNSPTILNPSVMIRKDIIDKYNIRYDERLLKAEDYKLWVHLSRIGICTNLKEHLLYYRTHKNQTSNRLRTKDVSDYDWIVLKEQYEQFLKINISPDLERMLRIRMESKDVDPIKYRKWLQTIFEANKKVGEYNDSKLLECLNYQWKKKVLNIYNPIVLVKLLIILPWQEKYRIIRIETERILKKCLLHNDYSSSSF